MGQDQIDYVVDGASSDAQIFHHQGRFQLDPALIKIIQIEKGTGSASAGIGATGGRIEAVTVDATDLLREGQNVGFRANAGLHTNKGHNLGLSVYGRHGIVDGLFSTNRVDERNYKDASGRTVGNSALDSTSYLAKIGLSVHDDLRLTLSHRRESEEGLRNLREEYFFDSSNDNPSHRERTITTTAFALAAKRLGFVNTLDLDLSHMHNQQQSAPPTDRSNVTDVDIRTTSANLRLSSRLNGTEHRIKYGVNFRNQEADSTGSRNARLRPQEKTDTGVYVEGIWQLQPFTLTTGVRYDHFNLTTNEGHKHSDGSINPSMGLIWDVNNALSLNLSHNRATRSPRFYEVLLANTPIRYSDNVQADRAQNTELGFDYNAGPLALKGSYFVQKIKGLQVFDGMNCRGRSCQYRLVSNRGSLENKGYELHATYRQDGLTARVGVTHSTPRLANGIMADSVAVALPMGRQWNTGVSYQFKAANLELGWRGRYAESRSYLNAGGNTVRRAGYGVHDLYASWQALGNDTLTVNVGIDNVGDKSYSSHSQRTSGAALPEAGREFRLGVNYRY